MGKEQTYLGYVYINNETVFEVGKFAILWNVFEDIKCDCVCNIVSISKIIKEINDDVYGIYNKELFKTLAAAFQNRAKLQGVSIEKYVETSLYPANDKRAKISNLERNTYMSQVADFINSGGKNMLEGALLAIWRIRNNMFHGLKGHSVLDEQIDLFRAMNNVLEEVNK